MLIRSLNGIIFNLHVQTREYDMFKNIILILQLKSILQNLPRNHHTPGPATEVTSRLFAFLFILNNTSFFCHVMTYKAERLK